MSLSVKGDREGLGLSLLFGKERFVELESLVFRQVNRDDLLVFRENRAGAITHAFWGLAPLTALRKNFWFEAPVLHLALLGTIAVVFLSFLVGVTSACLVQRKSGVLSASTPLERVAIWLTAMRILPCLLVLLAALASVFDVFGLYLGSLPLWKFVKPASSAVAVLALCMFPCAAAVWTHRCWSPARHVHYLLVSAAAASFVWFLYFWNLLGKGL